MLTSCFSSFPTDFLHFALKRVAHYNWLPFGHVLAAPQTFSNGDEWRWVEVALQGLRCHWMSGFFCLNDCITILSKVGHIPHSPVNTAPNLAGVHSGRTATLQPGGNALYLGVELSSASLCVQLSEPRHMTIIQLVQAYQSAKCQVNLYLYCPLKGNAMCSLSIRQRP